MQHTKLSVSVEATVWDDLRIVNPDLGPSAIVQKALGLLHDEQVKSVKAAIVAGQAFQ